MHPSDERDSAALTLVREPHGTVRSLSALHAPTTTEGG